MDLLLEIISHQRHAMTEEQSKCVFKAAGGTIGRNHENDWSIDDPERLISGQHASIQFENNQFLILDNSTNGLFINQEQQALGQRHHFITNGDIFLLGQYSIQATIISTQSKAVFSRSAHDSLSEPSFNNQPHLSGLINEHTVSKPFNTSAVNEASIPLFPHELPQNSTQYIDPLSQFNDGLTPGSLLQQDILAEPDAINSVLDHVPSTQSYFDLPNAIPENWLKNDFDNSQSQPQSQAVHSHLSQAPIQSKPQLNEQALPMNNDFQNGVDKNSINEINIEENKVGDFEDFKNDFNINQPIKKNISSKSDFITPPDNNIDDDTVGQRQSSQPINSLQNQQQNNSLHTLAATDNRPSQIPLTENSTISNTLYPDSQHPVDQELINILLENIGINSEDVSPEQLPELLKNIGLITRNSMSGIMKTMMSRADLKNEFRMSMTTIKTQENNPLKFCINYEQLVHYMLVKPMSGYLDSEQAVVESFDELQEHQVGVMAGMKSALNYMLEKLSPEKIVEKSDRSKSKTLALSSKKSRYWDAYNEIYNDIKNEDDAFTSLFGNEFCKAYERQIEDIRQARK